MNLFKRVPGKYIHSVVKFGSVTAEVFLLWTNFARTNVDWTNVTVRIGICQNGLWNLPLKFGPNQATNS